MHSTEKIEAPTLVYAVGDGVPWGDPYRVNALSGAIARKAAEVALDHIPSRIFIAGGNGSADSPRGARIPGSWAEAERMRFFLEQEFDDLPMIETDCDPLFREMYPTLQPSTNTILNAVNAAAATFNLAVERTEIVAERRHLPRVIGTYREQLKRLGILDAVDMHAHPVDAEFEDTNDQWHIRSQTRFRLWNMLSTAHHLLSGNVPRAEYAREVLTGRNYGHLVR